MKSSSSAVRSSSRLARLIQLATALASVVVLLAFKLRVFRLDFQPVWFDEDLAYQRSTAVLDVSLASMAGSPLYYVILRGWADLAGSSLYALRLFSALCGTLAVPLIYQVARRLLGREAALATMTLAVFAPFYIYYSQEARTYSLTLVLMLISMHAFLRWRDTRRWQSLAVCTLANLICLYTHSVAGLIILAQGMILLLLEWRDWKRIGVFVLAQTVAVLALVPWLIWVQQALQRVIAPSDSTTVDAWSVLARTWTEFSIGRTLPPPTSLYLAMVPLFLALAGLLSLFIKYDNKRLKPANPGRPKPRSRESTATTQTAIAVSTETRLILLVWLIVPIAGSLLIPRASVRFSPKYLIAITPVFYMLIVLACACCAPSREYSLSRAWHCLLASGCWHWVITTCASTIIWRNYQSRCLRRRGKGGRLLRILPASIQSELHFSFRHCHARALLSGIQADH